MKIAVIGATGRVGKAIVAEALGRGHEVIAICRNAGKLDQKPHLKAVAADVHNPDDTAKAVKGADAVISAYNGGWGDPKIRENFTTSTNSIIAGLKKAGIKRVLFVGGAGSLVEDGKRLIDKPDFNPQWKNGAEGAADALHIVRKEKDLEWSFFSPAMNLTDDAKTGTYKLGLDNPVKNAKGEHKVTMGDYAHAAVDEIEKPKHTHKRFTIGTMA